MKFDPDNNILHRIALLCVLFGFLGFVVWLMDRAIHQ